MLTISQAWNSRYSEQKEAHDLDRAICFSKGALVMCSRHPNLLSAPNVLGDCDSKLQEEFDISEDGGHNSKETFFPQNPLHPLALRQLGDYLLTRFELRRENHDLDSSINYLRELALFVPGDLDRSGSLTQLAYCLLTRYRNRGEIHDLEEAIRYNRQALLLPQPSQDPPTTLCNLGVCLHYLQRQKGGVEIIVEAAAYLKEAARKWPLEHPQRASCLFSLGNCLMSKYRVQHRMEDLEASIQCLEEALSLQNSDNPERPSVLHNLSVSHQTYYEHQGGMKNLEWAISRQREAMQQFNAEDQDRELKLLSLGWCLLRTYEQQGSVSDLDESIRLFMEVRSRWSPGNQQRPLVLFRIALALYARYLHSGSLQDLEEAISSEQEAVLLQSLGESEGSGNLGIYLWSRYERLGKAQDLEKALEYMRKALLHCSSADPQRSKLLTNLAQCIWSQYRRLDRIEDLEEAIKCDTEALSLQPVGHPLRSTTLSDLGRCYSARHRHPGASIQDLERAIQYERESLGLRQVGHPLRSVSLNTMGAYILKKSYMERNTDLLEEAIRYHKEALLLNPIGRPRRSFTLRCLGGCYDTQSRLTGNTAPLKDAIQYYQESINNCAPDDPLLVTSLASLAFVMMKAKNAFPGVYSYHDAEALFEQAVYHPAATLKDRFQVATSWITEGKDAAGISAYQACLELADQFIHLRPSVHSRRQLLSGDSIPRTLASDAAALAIENGDLHKAIELLEQGRTIIWSQLASYHPQLHALQDKAPELAARFEKLSTQLQALALAQNIEETPKQSMMEEAREYRVISDEWNTVADQIRQVDGFANFMKHPSFSFLRQLAQNGPVIVVNLGNSRCDAIIIMNDLDPVVVPLSDTSIPDTVRTIINFHAALEKGSAGRPGILQILRMLWDDIVHPVVNKLRELGVAPKSRIWWCPTCIAALLPLHAAGPCRSNQPNLPDIYISSYAPTLSALVESFRIMSPTTLSHHSFSPRLLLVTQPEAPGQAKIPCVWKELQRIEATVPLLDILQNENGNHQAVLEGLKTHSWIHISSHGVQDFEDPFNSCFRLHDKPLTLLDIIDSRRPDAQFAFLSACHSAAGDLIRPDETVSLASALQFIGFRSVIGTMYAMADIDGPQVAEEVYKHLFRRMQKLDGVEGSNPDLLVDYRDAAEALNIATKALRDSGVPVERWINFVHIGA
ncbi:hypothetical protein FRC02_007260 [Tulasnella sp. 418]|nr:hypothetical protein FRC02_007260 [Tulasnella sp. 418]